MILLPVEHELSQKFQNCAFKVIERFDWRSKDGLIPCLNIQSVLGSTRASDMVGWDTEETFIIKADDLNLV